MSFVRAGSSAKALASNSEGVLTFCIAFQNFELLKLWAWPSSWNVDKESLFLLTTTVFAARLAAGMGLFVKNAFLPFAVANKGFTISNTLSGKPVALIPAFWKLLILTPFFPRFVNLSRTSSAALFTISTVSLSKFLEIFDILFAAKSWAGNAPKDTALAAVYAARVLFISLLFSEVLTTFLLIPTTIFLLSYTL